MNSNKKIKDESSKKRLNGDELINHLNKVRKEVSRGRVFSDSAALIREMRGERDKELDRALRGKRK